MLNRKHNCLPTALACMFASLLAAFVTGCETPDRVEAYHAPLTSVGARFGALPAAVQNTIRAESGAAEIRDIDKEVRKVGPVYRVSYANEDLYPPLFVAADGSVINPDMTVAVGAASDESAVIKGGAAGGLRFADLPGPVASVVDKNGARSEILSMDKETWGSRVVYIISFKNETLHPRLYVTTDGTVLRDVRR
jgi:hypothetical protein